MLAAALGSGLEALGYFTAQTLGQSRMRLDDLGAPLLHLGVGSLHLRSVRGLNLVTGQKPISLLEDSTGHAVSLSHRGQPGARIDLSVIEQRLHQQLDCGTQGLLRRSFQPIPIDPQSRRSAVPAHRRGDDHFLIFQATRAIVCRACFAVALRIWRNRDESETGGPDLRTTNSTARLRKLRPRSSIASPAV